MVSSLHYSPPFYRSVPTCIINFCRFFPYFPLLLGKRRAQKTSSEQIIPTLPSLKSQRAWFKVFLRHSLIPSKFPLALRTSFLYFQHNVSLIWFCHVTWLGIQWKILITHDWLIEKYDIKIVSGFLPFSNGARGIMFTINWWLGLPTAKWVHSVSSISHVLSSTQTLSAIHLYGLFNALCTCSIVVVLLLWLK